MSSSRVEVSSVCARASAVCCWSTVVSSSSLSKGKKLDGWFRGVLDGDSGCEGSHQLELFKMEMVVVHEGTMPVSKLDLLLHLVLGKGKAYPLRSRVQAIKRVYTPWGQEFKDTS